LIFSSLLAGDLRLFFPPFTFHENVMVRAVGSGLAEWVASFSAACGAMLLSEYRRRSTERKAGSRKRDITALLFLHPNQEIPYSILALSMV
jgi:hypothetical protein